MPQLALNHIYNNTELLEREILTLYSAVLSDSNIKVFNEPGLTYVFNFLHLGTVHS